MVDGVANVSAMMTAHSDKAPPDLKPKPKPSQTGPQAVPGVDRIIAVASGKGGVGQVDRFCESRLCSGSRRATRGSAGRGCIWSVAAPHAGCFGSSRQPRWQDHPAAAQSRGHHDVDGV